MNIYIAYDYVKNPLSCIIAKNMEFAEIAFAAMDHEVHNIEKVDLNSDLIKSQNVIFLLNSKLKENGNTYWVRGK